MIQQRYTTLTLRMWHSIDQTVMRLLMCTVPTEVLGNSSFQIACWKDLQTDYARLTTKGYQRYYIGYSMFNWREGFQVVQNVGHSQKMNSLWMQLTWESWEFPLRCWQQLLVCFDHVCPTAACAQHVTSVPFGIPWNHFSPVPWLADLKQLPVERSDLPWKIGSPLRQMMWQRLHAWLPHCAPLNSCKSLDSPSEWLCFVGENIGINCLAMNFFGYHMFQRVPQFCLFFSCFFNIGIRRLGWLLSVHQPFFMLPRATRFFFTAGYALPAVPSEILRGGVGTQWYRWDKKNGYDWYML